MSSQLDAWIYTDSDNAVPRMGDDAGLRNEVGANANSVVDADPDDGDVPDGDAMAEYFARTGVQCEAAHDQLTQTRAIEQAMRIAAVRVARNAEITRVINKTLTKRRGSEALMKQFSNAYVTAWLLHRESTATRVFAPAMQRMFLLSIQPAFSLSDLTEDVCARKILHFAGNPMHDYWLRSLFRQVALSSCGALRSYNEYIVEEARLRRQPDLAKRAHPLYRRAKHSPPPSGLHVSGLVAAPGRAHTIARTPITAYHEWSRQFRDELVLVMSADSNAGNNATLRTVPKLSECADSIVKFKMFIQDEGGRVSEDALETEAERRCCEIAPLSTQFYDSLDLALLHPSSFTDESRTLLVANDRARLTETTHNVVLAISTSLRSSGQGTLIDESPGADNAHLESQHLALIIAPTAWEEAYINQSIETMRVPRNTKDAQKLGLSTTQAESLVVNQNGIQHALDFDPAKCISLGGLLMRFVYDWIHTLLSSSHAKLDIEASSNLATLSSNIASHDDGAMDDEQIHEDRRKKVASLLRGPSFSRKKLLDEERAGAPRGSGKHKKSSLSAPTLHETWASLMDQPLDTLTDTQLGLLGSLMARGITDSKISEESRNHQSDGTVPSSQRVADSLVHHSQVSVSDTAKDNEFFDAVAQRLHADAERLKLHDQQRQKMIRALAEETGDDLMPRSSTAKRKRSASMDPNLSNASIFVRRQANHPGDDVDEFATMHGAVLARKRPILTQSDHARIVRYYNDPSAYHGKQPTIISSMIRHAFPTSMDLVTAYADRTGHAVHQLLPSLFAVHDLLGIDGQQANVALIQQALLGACECDGNVHMQRIADTIRSFTTEGAIRSPELVCPPEIYESRDENSIPAMVATAHACCQFAQHSWQHARDSSVATLRQAKLDLAHRATHDPVHCAILRNVQQQTGIQLAPMFTLDERRAAPLLRFEPDGAPHETVAKACDPSSQAQSKEHWTTLREKYGNDVVLHLLQKRVGSNTVKSQNSDERALDDDGGGNADPLTHVDFGSSLLADDGNPENATSSSTDDRSEASKAVAASLPDVVFTDDFPTLQLILQNVVRSEGLAHDMTSIKKKLSEVDHSSLPTAVDDAVSADHEATIPRNTSANRYQDTSAANIILPATDADRSISAAVDAAPYPASTVVSDAPVDLGLRSVESHGVRVTNRAPGMSIPPERDPVARAPPNQPDGGATSSELIDFIDSQVPSADKHGCKSMTVDMPDGSQTMLTLKPRTGASRASSGAQTADFDTGDQVSVEQAPTSIEANCKVARIKSSEIGQLIFMALLTTCKMVHLLTPESQRSSLLPTDRIFRIPVTDTGVCTFIELYWPTLMEQIMVQIRYARYIAPTEPYRSKNTTSSSSTRKSKQQKHVHDRWDLVAKPITSQTSNNRIHAHRSSAYASMVASHCANQNGYDSSDYEYDAEMRHSDEE